MSSPAYDKKDQYEKIVAGLLQGEQVIAVFDCTGVGTGFVGVTNKRIVMQDNSFVGGKTAITSIPFKHVHSVSFVADKSVWGRFYSSSTVAITVGGHTKEATFRGDDKAKFIHDTILWHIS